MNVRTGNSYITLRQLMQREQTEGKRSTKSNQKSSKKMTRIKLHVKTQKTAHLPTRSLHRKSEDHNAPHHLSPLSHSKKGLTSLTCIQDKQSGLRWRLGRTEQTCIRPQDLPEISQLRVASGWVARGSIKRAEPTRSMKIAFKELVPIKEITKEDRLQNLRRIRDEFREVVNSSNHISVRNRESVFRAYVERGNNGVLVKQLMKKRWWWHLEEQPGKANFQWTEWFSRTAVAQMPDQKPHLPGTKDYSPPAAVDEPRVNSIRKILDESTFSRIRARISMRQEHYLRIKRQVNVEEEVKEVKEVEVPSNSIIHNHVDGCLQLHSKKLLFKNLYEYLQIKGMDPFEFIPVTYYIDSEDCPALRQLYGHCESLSNAADSMNMWIVKPGENSNRGFGISVHAGLQSLQREMVNRFREGKTSLVIQKYMEDCFLVEGRKFDIRCYILLTTVNGMLKGYWYADGYIRTSSEEYNLEDVENRMIHLTNDAVQKHNQSYGKFQDFNKMSFPSFRKYLFKKGFASNAFDKAYDKMKNIAYYLIASTSPKIRRKQYTFELFGLDFMLNGELSPFLIQANSNPCLETSGIILGKLIPQLVDNVLMTAVDPLFPAPDKGRAKEYLSKDYFRSNKFELIYNDATSN